MTLVNDDCLHYLSTVQDNTFDLIVTDPPYGIAFMGKDWDKALPDPQVWKECFRTLKEGKMAFIMCSPRQDVLSRMIISLEDSGFRTNYTSIYWSFASGFPKAANIFKMLNKKGKQDPKMEGAYVGFQPKPAVEVILVVSKGKSLTWLDDCRIPYSSDSDISEFKRPDKSPKETVFEYGAKQWTPYQANQKGRFPANLLVSDDVLNDGKIRKGNGGTSVKTFGYRNYCQDKGYDRITEKATNPQRSIFRSNDEGSYSRYFDLDAWAKAYSGQFIITPKASKSERNKGLENLPPEKVNDGRDTPIDNPFQRGETLRTNKHPTVKPLKLMSYLITMGSREGDLVLDPFVGSGTTYIAATQLNRKAVGIELNKEYYEIAQARLQPYIQQTKLMSSVESGI